jgi:hypothetical protein
MLLHAVIMWPDTANLELWPFALAHDIYLWNHLPRIDHGLAPIELFSGTKFESHDFLQRLHVWGCPVYVLDPKLYILFIKLPKSHPTSLTTV